MDDFPDFSDRIEPEEGRAPKLAIPAPAEIVRNFDRYIIGQHQAKKTLAVAVYTHYVSLNESKSSPSSCMLIGPTGCGKTALVRALAAFLKKPWTKLDLSAVTSPGYVGSKLEHGLAALLKSSRTKEEAETGILYLDECDKIRRAADTGGQPDITGLRVQYDLLGYLDGSSVLVTYGNTPQPFDTSRLFIILSGAFEGIYGDDERGPFGFAAADAEPARRDRPQEITKQRLIEYGFLNELVGRLTSIATLDALDEDALVNILRYSENSAIRVKEALFGQHGIELAFSDGAFGRIARQSAKSGTGAREISSLVNKLLLDTEYQLPELAAAGTKSVVVAATKDGHFRVLIDPNDGFRKGKLKRRKHVQRTQTKDPLLVSGDLSSRGVTNPSLSNDETGTRRPGRDRPADRRDQRPGAKGHPPEATEKPRGAHEDRPFPPRTPKAGKPPVKGERGGPFGDEEGAGKWRGPRDPGFFDPSDFDEPEDADERDFSEEEDAPIDDERPGQPDRAARKVLVESHGRKFRWAVMLSASSVVLSIGVLIGLGLGSSAAQRKAKQEPAAEPVAARAALGGLPAPAEWELGPTDHGLPPPKEWGQLKDGALTPAGSDESVWARMNRTIKGIVRWFADLF